MKPYLIRLTLYIIETSNDIKIAWSIISTKRTPTKAFYGARGFGKTVSGRQCPPTAQKSSATEMGIS